ncbi:murein transglycosylase A [Sphingoaurantiacus capsulatus]|uniref:peptidoglycan lytic exotransglycosylase n=1 Tax=Sphingoaurantiacus capsulatus TaxID=1771310 RepID=A0ABV7XCM5_9SPHN
MYRFLTLASLAVLAACSAPRVDTPAVPVPPPAVTPAPTPAPPAPIETALQAGVSAAPALAGQLGWAQSDPKPALEAFKKSCRALMRRTDATGLTKSGDWDAVCATAATATDARAFFETQFTPVSIGGGTGLNTGYFEPEILGSRTPGPGYAVPVYKRPSDLIEVDLGLFTDSLKGRRIRGRVEGDAMVPYYDRAAIEDGALSGKGLEIGYAADTYELFFLHIQGSGRLKLPDGSVMRIGYDGQNGREYVGIGQRLRQMNALGPGQASMDGIINWMKANPEGGRTLMRENKSYIFFKILTGDGPLGALNMALTPEYSVAADPKFVPLGAPLWLDSSIPEPKAPTGYTMTPFRRLMIAQDTGGAIKGANRLDLFWGPGDRARKVAGGLSSQGRTVLLLPKAVADRLLAGAAATPRR